MVLHLITETFYCTLLAHCFDTLWYIFLTWSMLETPLKNEYVSYQDNITLNSFYHLRPPTPGSSVSSLTDTSRAPTKESRTTSRAREFSQGTVCLEQNRAIPGVGGVGGGGYWWWKYDEVNRRGSWISCSFVSFCFRQTHRRKCSNGGLLNLVSLLAVMKEWFHLFLKVSKSFILRIYKGISFQSLGAEIVNAFS